MSQQHLIWQSVELEDDRSLHEYQIHSGATLQLVLGMRGGPVNTRRGTNDLVFLIVSCTTCFCTTFAAVYECSMERICAAVAA